MVDLRALVKKSFKMVALAILVFGQGRNGGNVTI